MEVLLVLALLGVIASATSLFSLRSLQSAVLQAERNTVIVQLQTARTLAMQNKNGVPYGVAFNPEGYRGYVLFAGTNFESSATATQIHIPGKPEIILATSTPAEIVFKQLSGESSYDGVLTFIKNAQTEATTSIMINYEGAIY